MKLLRAEIKDTFKACLLLEENYRSAIFLLSEIIATLKINMDRESLQVHPESLTEKFTDRISSWERSLNRLKEED